MDKRIVGRGLMFVDLAVAFGLTLLRSSEHGIQLIDRLHRHDRFQKFNRGTNGWKIGMKI